MNLTLKSKCGLGAIFLLWPPHHIWSMLHQRKRGGKKIGLSTSKPGLEKENLQILKKLHQIRFIYECVGGRTMTSFGLCWGQGRRNLSGTSTKEKSSGTDMFALSDQPLLVEGGRELCLTGGGLEGGGGLECNRGMPDTLPRRNN